MLNNKNFDLLKQYVKSALLNMQSIKKLNNAVILTADHSLSQFCGYEDDLQKFLKDLKYFARYLVSHQNIFTNFNAQNNIIHLCLNNEISQHALYQYDDIVSYDIFITFDHSDLKNSNRNIHKLLFSSKFDYIKYIKNNLLMNTLAKDSTTFIKENYAILKVMIKYNYQYSFLYEIYDKDYIKQIFNNKDDADIFNEIDCVLHTEDNYSLDIIKVLSGIKIDNHDHLNKILKNILDTPILNLNLAINDADRYNGYIYEIIVINALKTRYNNITFDLYNNELGVDLKLNILPFNDAPKINIEITSSKTINVLKTKNIQFNRWLEIGHIKKEDSNLIISKYSKANSSEESTLVKNVFSLWVDKNGKIEYKYQLKKLFKYIDEQIENICKSYFEIEEKIQYIEVLKLPKFNENNLNEFIIYFDSVKHLKVKERNNMIRHKFDISDSTIYRTLNKLKGTK